MKSKIEIHLEKINSSKLTRFFFDKPVLKLIVLVVLGMVLMNLIRFFPNSLLVQSILTVVNMLITIYFIFSIIFIVRNRIKYLMNPKNLKSLIWAYVILIFVIIFVFSNLFSLVNITRQGYLTYGDCSDSFSVEQMNGDSQISRSFFYFSAITFFSVGYGDICPMGLSKTLSIIVALVGHVISVLLVAIILSNYLKFKSKKN